MKVSIRFFMLLLLCGAPTLSLAQELRIPAAQNNYVNDYTALLAPADVQQLQNTLREIEQRRGVEISIVMISSKSVVGHSGTIEQLAQRWFDHWGVGNLPANNGILILLALYDREVRIELGQAYAHRYDREMQTIIDHEMLPAFKRADYASGLKNTVKRLQIFVDEHAGAQGQPPVSESVAQRIQRAFTPWWTKLLLAFGALVGAGLVYQRRQRHKPRNCAQCQAPMVRLSEQADDRYLNPEQKVEEKVGSVDYDVWKCTKCPHYDIAHFSKWLRSTRQCPKCKRQTATNQHTDRHSDYVTEHWHCQSCQHQFQRFREIRRSSNNGFGGGSSGGGGATGRW